MTYYEVFVASPGYQKQEPLTYSFEGTLAPGTVVVAPFGPRKVVGFIHKAVNKPAFATKSLLKILDVPALPKQSRDLHAWLMAYYAAPSGMTTQLFTPSGLLVAPKKEAVDQAANTPAGIQKVTLPPLTTEQTGAIQQIESAPHHHVLLHGETGSGKTRIYIERTQTALNSGRSAIILTPEISLTPQLVRSFTAIFGNKVVLLHSGLTASARRDIWLKIARATDPLVIVGPRSALFTPVKNVGLIVMDEMHEPAYKQDQAPKYHALRVAGSLAKLHTAEVIYGSATPPVADYYLAEHTKMPVIRMSESAKKAGKVKISTVNLREKDKFVRNRNISDELITGIEKRLRAGEQSLLFLNRRGTARLVLCQTCGWQALCPNCDLPLTFHADFHELRCHTCGHQSAPPYQCPECRGTELRYQTIGTKALVDSLESLFPEARIRRFDTDTGAKDTLDKHYDAVRAGDVDILVGTQMLGKGLDLPHLSLVGIVQADSSLNIPDYSSAERSYQLLHQAIGRVGRGHLPGEVIVQTLNPENPILKSALDKDWQQLYRDELKERKSYGFPPFCFLLKIGVSRKTEVSAEKAATKLQEQLKNTNLQIETGDPAPAFYGQSHSLFHWQIVIKSTKRSELLAAIKALKPGDWTFDLDPINLL